MTGFAFARWLACLALALPLTIPAAAPVGAVSPLGAPRFAAVLMDADTNEILYAEQPTAIRHPASITKVMTLYLVFDALDAGRLRLDDRVVMTPHAASQRPSKLGLGVGQSLSVADAISVVAVKSANDVAVALAEKVGGTEANFARLMTAKARQLGMRQTVFANASGLPDPAHFTSAQDIAILSAAMIRNHPARYHCFSERSFSYGKLRMANHNKLLGNVVGLDGIKTGFTNDSGFTLTASAVRDGRRLIAVVLGSPSGWQRDRDITSLLNAGFTALDIRRAGRSEDMVALLSSSGFALNRGLRPMPRIAALQVEEGDTE
ncbi:MULTISPECIES: D-alanyl-D-alanine carboxypeptidase family protein [unclassified Sphingomonas]|uniref:D-alanyl-D-alanine carboxypeptidase family protein n=1 Tax=unclassified Sphingomonas TaxID=196159 RepID=UPI0007005E87|nr:MULTISPECIES: D-alanyl-D-alanine carboxypeptidase family protein [unclassified Sphingomonas]KQX26221.1 D-alanyl-D-alanine carboxypeptidase [Sphingomonas sp. Root1294]KQY69288.1 D-alanyl-D-alanine carboxypeptidase [Sphingomonas sp. Root50]KRB89544.1 D-alanyl-D-alanine carboxypeptidase [Sphingomonas sp. Root720]